MDEDWLFDLIWRFQDATAVEIVFEGEGLVHREEFHPVVDVVMDSLMPDGKQTIADWYAQKMDALLLTDDDDDD